MQTSMTKNLNFITLIKCIIVLLSLNITLSSAILNAAPMKKIVVIMKKTSHIYNSTLKGLKAELGSNSSTLTIYDSKTKKLFERVAEEKPDILITFGTRITIHTVKKFKSTPIVYTSVLGNLKLPADANTITGVTLNIPIKEQFSVLKEIVPGLKRIGVIYNPKYNLNYISKADGIASLMNLKLISKKITVYSEIIPKFTKLINQVDILWIIADPTVCKPANIKYLLINSLKLKKPVYGISPGFVKNGALVSLTCDYFDIGKQTGLTVKKIIKGTSISKIPPVIPRKTKLYLNANIAHVLGITIPNKVKQKVYYTYGK